MTRTTALTVVFALCLLVPSARAAQFQVERDDDGITVNVDGEFFTRYLVKSGAKPILWPILGPTGKEMTRAYPMRDATPDERDDHVHHRSLWFTHGDVNGIDFWGENEGHGTIVHRKFLKVQGGDSAVIQTLNDWIGPDDKKHCQDVRTFTFGAGEHARWIDVDITVMATDGKVTFGDTKEGSFGVRVAGTMKVTLNRGGTIVNSNGETNADAWGKRAKWVDYFGPVDGDILGVAILNHPSSLRFPTYWHVRTYGLFTANPFGLHHFRRSDEFDGSLTLQPGESFVLRHRVLFHRGNVEQGEVAEAFARYAKLRKTEKQRDKGQ